MAKYQSIQIGCPEYGGVVRGSYACDDGGKYLLGRNGEFLLNRARCGQMDGRCAQTLCAFHRFNRRGPGTWYPDRLFAAPQAAPAADKHPRTPLRDDKDNDSSISFQA